MSSSAAICLIIALTELEGFLVTQPDEAGVLLQEGTLDDLGEGLVAVR
jgi:hypothetical protein